VKIGAKIAGSMAVILCLMLLMGGYSFFSSYSISRDTQVIQSANSRAIIAAKAENEYTGAVLEIRRYIADGDEKYSKNFEEKLTAVQQLEQELLLLTPPDKTSKVDKLIADTNKYKEGVVTRLIPVLREQYKEKTAGNAARSAELAQTSGAITKELTPFAQSIQQTLHTEVGENADSATQLVKQTVNDIGGVVKMSSIISVLALVLGILFAFYLTRQITKPIYSLSSELDELASGNFACKMDKSLLNRKDEFGHVEKALEGMKSQLTELIRSVQDKSESLSASSEQLTASAEQSAQAATQVAESIATVATGADKQAKAVHTTLSVVEKASADANEVAQNAKTAAETSQKTANAALDGGKLISSATTQMAGLEKTVGESAIVVRKLGESSKQIGQIVDAITGIAGQTNLLALNAAVEAARAGEQGKGFAVVAEEVRKLAEQAEEAAKQIGDLIREIQLETEQAVKAMNAGTVEVKATAQVVDDAGKAFSDIIRLIEEVSAEVSKISAAAQQISTGSLDIVTAVRGIDTVTKETAAQTQSVSAATEEETASMEEIAASSRSLAQLAEELQASTAKFRV
jgi:methyl-accepting chemotaxis protein